MNKLDGIDADALREALAGAEDPKAVKRLMVALAYHDGARVEALSARYGIPRSTLYYWLDRFEEQPIPEAITDERRPGRPPKLDAAHREQLLADLRGSPADCGYDSSAWTPDLVRHRIERIAGVTYSLGHVRRLLREMDDHLENEKKTHI